MAALAAEDDPSWETHLATPAEAAQVDAMKAQLGDALTTGCVNPS